MGRCRYVQELGGCRRSRVKEVEVLMVIKASLVLSWAIKRGENMIVFSLSATMVFKGTPDLLQLLYGDGRI